MARLFLAVWPPAEAVEQLHALERPARAGVRWVPPGQWHVTLRFLGDAAPEDVIARLAHLELPAATAVLGPAVRRLGRGIVVVPVDGLGRLGAAVRAATADVGEPPGRPFSGHLTLARLRNRATCDLVGVPISVAVPVTEVVLVDSVITRQGATYHVVGRWPTGR